MKKIKVGFSDHTSGIEVTKVMFREISIGEKFNSENICFKGPKRGINLMRFMTLLEKGAKRHFIEMT